MPLPAENINPPLGPLPRVQEVMQVVVTTATFGPIGSIRLGCGRPPVDEPALLIQRGCCGGRSSPFGAQAFDQP
jgi:hypothetical protein